MTEEELRDNARDEKRRHNESNDGRSSASMFEEKRQERKTEGCPAPLNGHNDREAVKGTTWRRCRHDTTLSFGL
jgi:hypothetical protein